MHGLAVVAAMLAVLLAGGLAAAADGTKQGSTAREQKAVKKKSGSSAEKAFGRPGDPRKVKRVIRVDMSDTMRYFPSEIRVKRGATVRFLLRNSGKMPHEMVLGTMDELKKYAALVKRSGEPEEEAAHAAHVAPGGTGRIVWQFTRAGEFYYGCLVPGHFDAGMIGTIVVR